MLHQHPDGLDTAAAVDAVFAEVGTEPIPLLDFVGRVEALLAAQSDPAVIAYNADRDAEVRAMLDDDRSFYDTADGAA